MTSVMHDVRYALRGFLRQPGTTLLVVAMLALGGPRWLGAITPIGGLLMIVSFVLLAIAVLR